jgi:hypothetical protein
MVNKISQDVRDKNKYKRYSLIRSQRREKRQLSLIVMVKINMLLLLKPRSELMRL